MTQDPERNKVVYREYYLKNMICTCCSRLLKILMEQIGVTIESLRMGEIRISFDPENIDEARILQVLHENGFDPVNDNESRLTEQIKLAVIDLVHHSTFNSMVRNSDFLVEKFNLSYQHISSLFSKHVGITLEKYIIIQKIEKAKELIISGELTLSEIAYIMGYSSVQYLSTQFKNVTGVSVSEFKKDPARYRRPVDELNG